MLPLADATPSLANYNRVLLVGEFLFVQAAVILLNEFLVATRELLLQGGKSFRFTFGIANFTPGGA